MIDLALRHAECGTDVADCVAYAVGIHHRHARHSLVPKSFEDCGVNLKSAGGFDIEVDVGQRATQWGEEALHHQVVCEWIDPRNTKEIVDETASARTTRRNSYAHLSNQRNDVGDGKEIAREAEGGNDVEFLLEAFTSNAHVTLWMRGAISPL